MIFDISNGNTALKTLIAMLDNPLVDHLISGYADDSDAEDMLDNFQLKGMHVTTCDDNCESIRSNGILPLCDVLSGDYALGKFLRDCQGIDLRDEDLLRECFYAPAQLSVITSKLYSDNRVSAYLHSRSRDEGYYERPEFLYNCISRLSFQKQQEIVTKWLEGKRTFCVHFEVALRDVATINDILPVDGQEDEYSAKWVHTIILNLLTLAQKVSEGQIDENIVMTLKPELIVGPESITNIVMCS